MPTDAAAVVLNVTTTNNSAAGYLSVFPSGPASQPLVSNLNWAPGQTIANLVAVPVGSNGKVTLFSSTQTDVVADLQGFFGGPSGSAGSYAALTPARITDTRGGSGLPNAGLTLASGGTLSVQVSGAGGVPSGATAAVLNVTATDTGAAGYLTVYPAGASKPLASNLNWAAGQTRANRVIAPLGSGGKINIFNAAGNANVVVDVSGYYSSAAGLGYMPLNPVRIADTRLSASTLAAGDTLTVQVAGVGGAASNAKAAILNLTATNATAAGYLTAYPGGSRPLASDLNFKAGETVPNLLVATLSSTGTVSIFNPSGSTDVVVDLFGFLAPAPPTAGVTVAADPSSLAADGATTSAITVTATNASGGPIFSDPVSLTMTGSPAGACGSLDSASGITDANGQFKATYMSSQVVGACTIAATEAMKGLSGSATITQSLAPYKIVVLNDPNNLKANGLGSAAIWASVKDVSATAVANDLVSFSLAGHPSSASCGTLTAASGTTDVNGQVRVTYVASTSAGFCVVTGTEAATGSSSKTTPLGSTMDQTTNPKQLNDISSSPSNDMLKADGKATDKILATVTDHASGGAIQGDEVMFSLSPGGESPAAACGTISPAFGATDASGQLSATYTASTTAGQCDITVLEANGHSWTVSHINQKQVLNSISLSANPSSIPADSVSTSTLTATITDVTGAAVKGDTVQFNVFGCGSVSPGSSTTDASGKATTTYTAGIFIGFCSIQAIDQGPSAGQGASTSTLITQTLAKPSIAVSASPSSIDADNATHSTVTVKVSSGNGGSVAGDPIHLTKSGSPAAACGNLGPVYGWTDASGEFVANYKSTFTPGTCTITATEAIAGLSASTTITQKLDVNDVSLSLTSSSLPADGASTAGIGAHVTDVTDSVVANDKVTFTLTGSPAAACGTLSSASATTDASGNAGVTYTASTTTGFCKIGASEAATGGSASAVLLDQTTNPAESNHVGVSYNGGSIPANGKATKPLTIRVADNGPNRPVQGDPVMLSLNGDACGTVSPALGFTDSSGLLSATYTASATAGPCDVVATEANGGASGNAVISQDQVANSVGVAANPSSIKGDGASTSTVIATITDVTGAAVALDNVAWSVSGPAGCGTLSNLGSSMTDASGHVSATYTAGTTIGFCTVTAEDLGPSAGSDASFGPGGVTGSTQIDQLGPTFSAPR